MIKAIPAIDVIEGKCVRLTEGDFSTKKVYDSQPLEVALKYEDAGFASLHLIDLDGARLGRTVNWKVLEGITSKTSLKVQFGGGIHTSGDLKIAFECGAQQVIAGSIAVKDEELFRQWLTIYGGDKIILGADVKNGHVAISGWAEQSKIKLNELIGKFEAEGLRYVLCTDISKDGKLKGPAFDLYEELNESFPGLNMIASGGISSMNDIAKLNGMNVYGVVIGKALYEGNIDLKELSRWQFRMES